MGSVWLSSNCQVSKLKQGVNQTPHFSLKPEQTITLITKPQKATPFFPAQQAMGHWFEISIFSLGGEVFCITDYFSPTNAKRLPQVFISCYKKRCVERRKRDNAPLFLEEIYCA